MAAGISIMGSETVIDPGVPGGAKDIFLFGVSSSTLIGTTAKNSAIHAAYPGKVFDGCVAICPDDGTIRYLIDGVWRGRLTV